ncbi:hypothetical protein DOM22_17925 [Bdellovibrio sp. ZAP7]|uniref:hypothetical protein n=1 Tax=Bdellovibrio sp. ZAP7 TaxID=2231053 RepID=UPI00115AD1F3|nr:hypothetical protein [Bdellovibrio sp. ZAP7]QDK46898.1 hypothetical protein DOM22_17925 [Bdellovibrio sp. ZAP7]
MKALIGALVLAGLFTSQANAASCGQMIENKAKALTQIKSLTAQIKASNNADVIEVLTEKRQDYVDYAARLEVTINELCKADYND